jgi:hypothetical protein
MMPIAKRHPDVPPNTRSLRACVKSVVEQKREEGRVGGSFAVVAAAAAAAWTTVLFLVFSGYSHN